MGSSALAATAEGPQQAPAPLSLVQGVVLTLLLLVLNSILASLGSILWSHFPYWPAFMVYALTCAFWGRWGLILAVLSPVVSCLLGIGGAPSYLYVPVNFLQAALVLVALHWFRIDPKLGSLADVLKYLNLAVVVPSFAGGATAWALRQWTDPNANDPPLLNYSLWWTIENLVPVVLPGVWLHWTVGELYSPVRREKASTPRSWMVNTLYYATPWMLTLLIVGALVVVAVWHQISGSRVTPSIWNRVHEIAAASLSFRLLVLALSVAILCSLGLAIRFAKHAWFLEVEMARRRPFKSATLPPPGRQLVSVLFADIRGFQATAVKFPPAELVSWLNTFFDRMGQVCAKRGGYIDKFLGDGLLLVFGLGREGPGAADAIGCALDMLDELESLNGSFRGLGYPEIRLGIGIHTGPVIAGEMGSRDRLQFTVVGDTVNVAFQLEKQAGALSSGGLPVVISDEAAREAGLLLDATLGQGMMALARDVPGLAAMRVWGLTDTSTVRSLLGRATRRRSGAGQPREQP
jgi:class 3 adenylate cyclase